MNTLAPIAWLVPALANASSSSGAGAGSGSSNAFEHVLVWTGAALALAALLVLLDIAQRGECSTPGIGILRAINTTYTRLVHGVRPGASDPLPRKGAAIVVANHRSGVDPLVVQAYTKRIIRFMMAREYYLVPGMRWFFRLVGAIPVNRDGNDLPATKAALRALSEGEVVGIFPEGGIRGSADAAAAEPIKHGAAMLAIRARVPVYAAWIEGTPPRDSVLAAIFTPSRSQVRYGPPILLEAKGRKPTRAELEEGSRRIRAGIETLKHEACAHAEGELGSPV